VAAGDIDNTQIKDVSTFDYVYPVDCIKSRLLDCYF